MPNVTINSQNVINQYIADVINFGEVESKQQLLTQLDQLQSVFALAQKEKLLQEDTAASVQTKVTEVIEEAHKPQPDQKKMLEHITGAKELLSGVSGAASLVTTLINAAQAVQMFF